MEPSFDKQIFSASASTGLSLLHGLKKILSFTNYSLGAVYDTINGPYRVGHQPFETAQDALPMLTLLGGERAVGKHAKAQQRRRASKFFPEQLFALSGLSSKESFCADDLTPMNAAFGPEGLHSPVAASYIVHIEILADSNAHQALCSIGSAEFHLIQGWLSENMFESGSTSGARAPKRLKRYVCMEAFDYRTNMEQIALALQAFTQGTMTQGMGPANCKVRIYKLFGSVGKGL